MESTQEPFYRLLRTRKDQKKHLLYDTGHNIPRNELIKEALNWLDQLSGTGELRRFPYRQFRSILSISLYY